MQGRQLREEEDEDNEVFEEGDEQDQEEEEEDQNEGEDQLHENQTSTDQSDLDKAKRLPNYRRELRQDILNHMLKTVAKEKELIQAPASGEYRKLIEEGNKYAKNIVHAREGALDAEWLAKIAEIGLHQVTKIQVGQEWSADDFLEKLISKYPTTTADSPIHWANVGKDALKYFLTTPSATFLHGPLRAEPKERKQAKERRAKINLNNDAEKPEEIREQQHTQNEMEVQTNKLSKNLKSKSQQGKQNVDYFSLVLDKQSFTKTIENMFYYSFLVKEGKASMQVEGDKVVGSFRESKENDPDDRKQTVIKLNLDMWAKLVESNGGDASKIMEEAKKKMPNNPNAKRTRQTANQEEESEEEEQASSSRTPRKVARRK